MKKKWKIIFGIIGILAAAAFIFTQLRQDLPVAVQRMEAREFVQSFTEEGVVVAAEEHPVYSLHPARIEKLLVEEGDRVQAGQLLAVLADRELHYGLEELEARLAGLAVELDQAQENLAAAERNYERMASLYGDELVAAVELEEAERMVQEAQARIALLEAQEQALLSQREGLQEQRKDYRIYAPIDGVVTRLAAREQGLASPQTPMMTLFNEGGKEVETWVLARDIPQLAEGMHVELTFKLRDQDIEFPGQVVDIAPYAEEAYSPLGLAEERVKVTIAPQFPAEVEIKPGYKVDVEFVTQVIPGALVVPKTVLFSDGGEDALFVVEGDRAQVRRVTTGPETRRDVVITAGLAEGDLVILDPRQGGLGEGVKVSCQIISQEVGE
jgi:HlyD family secretion protein